MVFSDIAQKFKKIKNEDTCAYIRKRFRIILYLAILNFWELKDLCVYIR